MQYKQMTLTAAIAAALMMMSTAQADTWEITQTVTPNSATTTMLQNGATASGSLQAMNAIQSSTATVDGTQELVNGANNLTLKQEGTTKNSNQSVNYANLNTVGSAAKALSQKYSGSTSAGKIELNQMIDATEANKQSVNTALSANIINLNQDLTTAYDIELKQATASSATKENIQTINNLEATTTLTTAQQKATPTNSLVLKQGSSGNQIQAANRAVANEIAIGDLTQISGTATKNTTLEQLGTGKNIQAVNMAVGKGVTTSAKQTANGVINLKQGDSTTVVGNGSIQAGNYLVGGAGVVNNPQQTFGSTGDNASLTQTKSANATVQAGNLIDMTSTEASAKLVEDSNQKAQTINLGSGTLTLQQTSTTSALQAGNAVITGNNLGGKVSQTATAAAISLTQTDATASKQASNFVGTF